MPSPSRVKWAKFRVAAVGLVASLIVATLVYLLTGGTLLQEKATIFLYIPDATGLSKDSPVRVDGIDVGKVAAVDLSGSNQANRVIRVTMRVERDRLSSIPATSFAQLSSDNLVGDKFVDITSGEGGSHVAAKGEIVFKSQGEFMKSSDLQDFEKQLREVDQVLTDIEQGKSRVGQFVLGDQFYNDLRKRMSELQRGMRAIASTTSSVGEALYSDKLFQEISGPLVALDQGLAQLQSGQGTGGQLLRDSAAYDQILATATSLRRTISDLRSSDFIKSDQAYKDWNRALGSLIQTVEQMNANPMLTRSDTYENLNGMAKEFRDTLKDFRQDPRKYLRLKVF